MHIHFCYLLFLNHELRKTFRKYKAKNRAEENVWETKEFCKLRVNFFSKWGGTAVYVTKDSIQILFVCVLGTDLTAKCFSSFLNTAYQDDTKPLLSKYSRELRTINWLLVLGNIFKSNQIPNFFFSLQLLSYVLRTLRMELLYKYETSYFYLFSLQLYFNFNLLWNSHIKNWTKNMFIL